MSTPWSEFEEVFRRDRANVIAVVGTGLSVAATRASAPEATWHGLLRSGVAYAFEHGLKPEDWADRQYQALGADDLDELLGVAERVEKALTDGGNYPAWLDATIGRLQVADDSLIKAVAGLGVRIVTTNYDKLIEDVTGFATATWQDQPLMERILRGDRDRAVLHLHGHYERPQTTVLGLRSYESIVRDESVQSLLQAIFRQRTLVFIGCGAGLEDPNLGALREWLAAVGTASPYRHYRLVTEREAQAGTPLLGDLVSPVVYGPDHRDLGPRLSGLAAEAPIAVAARAERPTLELRITAAGVVAVARPGGTEHHGDFLLDPVRATTAQMLVVLVRERDQRGDEPEEAVARLLGRILYEAVLNGDVHKEYTRMKAAASDTARLTIVIRIPPKLAVPVLEDDGTVDVGALPWELLYGPEGWLATARELTLVRAPHQASISGPRAAHGDLRVLVLSVQPAELIEAARERWAPAVFDDYRAAQARIRATIAALEGRPGVASLTVEDEPTEDRVRACFGGPDDVRPNVVHYIGFGRTSANGRGTIALMRGDEAGKADFVAFHTFAERCRALRPRLVFLHLCPAPPGGDDEPDYQRANFALLARMLLERGVGLVVAMQYPLLPDQGAEFTDQFYRAVGDGRTTVAVAVQRARAYAASFYRLGGPVLYVADEDDVLVTGPEVLPTPEVRAAVRGTVSTSAGPGGGHAQDDAPPPPALGTRADVVDAVPAARAPSDDAPPAPPPSTSARRRSLTGLRLLARPVAREVGLPEAETERVLDSLWDECGGGSGQITATHLTEVLERRAGQAEDGAQQDFLIELYERLSRRPA